MNNNIKEMFDEISDRYDFLNNVISFYTHFLIKKSAVKLLGDLNGKKVLDLCTGSGDLAGITKRLNPMADVIGADFSPKMLEIAKKKYKDIEFKFQDAVNLTFEDDSFDVVLMGFGLRNIQDKKASLNEILRVLKKGGYYLHIDFGRKNLISRIFEIITPILARIFSGKKSAYKYLINSKKSFPSPEELIKIFNEEGFKLILRKDYIFGVISAQILEKASL